MNSIILAILNLLEAFIQANSSKWISELIQALEGFLPKAKAQLVKKLEFENK